ncbi:hypothetical protein F5Y03DRAFT_44967 [Xylaria venustula]|nr:hypothetical protein F5Y03DRAFT_44967 [Xylaria venustula]
MDANDAASTPETVKLDEADDRVDHMTRAMSNSFISTEEFPAASDDVGGDNESDVTMRTPSQKGLSKMQLLKKKKKAASTSGTPSAQRAQSGGEAGLRSDLADSPDVGAPPQARPQQRPPQHQQHPARHETESIIGGRNIGSGANEPDWSREDLKEIARAESTKIGTKSVSDTRRSVPDPERKYVRVTNKGTIVATENSMLPNLDFSRILVGVGISRPDTKLQKGLCYSDIVCMGINSDWVLNQWTMQDVIMEPVDENILNKPARVNNGRPERRIGHYFARFRFPKKCIAPIFVTINSIMPGILDGISSSTGYYWMNASWGVNANPGIFVYFDENSVKHKTSDLSTAIRMLRSSSSRGIATIAISASCESNELSTSGARSCRRSTSSCSTPPKRNTRSTKRERISWGTSGPL